MSNINLVLLKVDPKQKNIAYSKIKNNQKYKEQI